MMDAVVRVVGSRSKGRGRVMGGGQKGVGWEEFWEFEVGMMRRQCEGS